MLREFRQDCAFGVRNWVRRPGLTAIAGLSLALGIGATTAIFSVVDAVILNPFPYRDVDTLMSVKVWEPGQRGSRLYYTTDQFLEIAARNSIFSRTVASTVSDVIWTGAGEPQRLRGNFVTRGTFETMGVPPLVGRSLVDGDYAAGAAPACVLGYKFWQRQFGGDEHVLGRQLRLNDTVRTVVGVMPRRFMWRGADVYVPFSPRRGVNLEGIRMVHVLGRLKPGVTAARAEGDLHPIIADLARQNPAMFPERWRVGLESFKETFRSAIREAVWILLGAVGLLLLLACANVSNLLLAHAAARQKEIAIRASLGAGRLRLGRQLLTESLLLALAAGLLGVGLAYAGLKAIISIVPPNTIPDEAVISLNGPVLLFTLAVCAISTLLFGLAPVLHACAGDLVGALKNAARGSTGGRRQRGLRGALVVAEVGLSLVLLVGASLMLRTLLAMQSVPLGIRADRVLTMRIPLDARRYPDPARRVTFFRQVLERVRQAPGVEAVGLNTYPHPLGNYGVPVDIPGNQVQDHRDAEIHQVNADYLRVMGIPLLAGRLFNDAETFNARHVALVNQAFAKRYFSGGEALGRLVRIPEIRQPPFRATDDSFEIIGVVRDTINRELTSAVWPEMYFPYTVLGMANYLAVLTSGDPAAVAPDVRREVLAVDPYQPVTDVRTIERLLDDYVFSERRFNLVLFAVFAAIGLSLALVGVYGVMSHAVTERRQEFGVRIALGAGSADIVRMVLRQALLLIAGGVAAGLAASLLLTRFLSQQIWRVSRFDAWSFGAVAALLLLAGLQACVSPALRAARTDPSTALRLE